MIRTSVRATLTALALIGTTASSAQLPNLSSGSGSGLLGALLPNVATTGAGNAAGVLSYCLKNKLLGATENASSVLGKLTGKPGVKQSDGFSLGKNGLLQTQGSTLPLDGLKSKLKSKVCDLVLNHATSLL